MFQGVANGVVDKICHQGFGTASVLDDGYFGRGFFFFFQFKINIKIK